MSLVIRNCYVHIEQMAIFHNFFGTRRSSEAAHSNTDFENLRVSLNALKACAAPGATLTKLCTQLHGSDLSIPDPLNGVSRIIREVRDEYLEFVPAPLESSLRFVRVHAETATRFYWPEVPGLSILFPATGRLVGFISANEFVVNDQVSYSVYSLKPSDKATAVEKIVIQCQACQQRMRVPRVRNHVATCPTCGAGTSLDPFC